MARKKVTLQWIANDATRRATFKKRRKGLLKKASELATLCDVDACVVVYGEGETQPEVWPDAQKAGEVLSRFKAMPELEQYKKMMGMGDFLTQRVDKLKEQLQKTRRENHERETTLLLHDAIVGRRPGLLDLSVEEVAGLGHMVENRLLSIKQSFEDRHHLGQGQQQVGSAAAAAGKQPLQQQVSRQDNNYVPPMTLQHHQLQQLPVSLPPLVPPYSMGPAAMAGHTEHQVVHQAPLPPHLQPQASWLMEVARAGGDLGALVYSGFASGSGSFGGGDAGAGTSAGTSAGPPVAGDSSMLPQLGSLGPGFAWHDAGFPPFPPM